MSEPLVQRFGEEIYVAWPGRYVFQFGHFLQAPWGLQAEVSVTSEAAGEQAWGQIQLTSADSRGKLAKQLDPDVVAMFHMACRLALGCYRQPPAWQELGLKPITAVPWFWTDWIPANQTTVLYADGDSGKSLLALTLAVCALTGLPFAGTWPIATVKHCLFVDYESSPEDHEHRLALICRALEVTNLDGMHYLQATQPISELVPVLKAQRDRTHAELVILDSASMASGHEPESAKAALEWVSALRQLAPATRLAVAHLPKSALANPSASMQAYGSVQVRNGPRCSILMRRQPDAPAGLHVTLHVNKNNLLHHKPPDVGLCLDVDDDAMAWRRATVPKPKHDLPIIERILPLIPEAAEDAISRWTLAERLNLDPDSVLKALKRAADKGLVRSVHLGGKGSGDHSTWIRILPKVDKVDRFDDGRWTEKEDDPGF